MGTYEEFLKKKQTVIVPTGFDCKDRNPNLFDWQNDVVRWALRKGKSAIFSDCGSGKGQPYGSKVLAESGWINIEDLKVGQRVFSSDGKLHEVKGVYPKGELDTYRFYYGDNTSLVFDIDHLHIVRTQNMKSRHQGWKVMSTKELLDANNLRYGKNKQSRNYSVPLVSPVQYPKKDFMINPYVIGALIGNGYIHRNVSFSSADEETIRRVSEKLPEDVELKYRSGYDYDLITGPTGTRKHPFRQELIRLGLYETHSGDKFIPEEYQFGSVEQRIDLLRGLMDTDGCIQHHSCRYNTASEHLAKDVLELAWSLGGYGTISRKKSGYKGKDGYVPCQDSYTVFIAFDEINPFTLTRKAEQWKPHARDIGRYIDRIEYEGKQKTVCISVDSPDHSYVTENFLVTHNTRMQLWWGQKVHEHENAPVLILAPLTVAQQTKREGAACGVDVKVVRDQSECINGLNVTNYEMLSHFDAKEFCGIVLDESSILKHKDGKTRQMIQDMFEETKFKLCCTATPAPNDFMELGTHAQFLGVMKQTEMLATFFVHDGGETQNWRLKGHAEKKFFEWVAGWACCFRRPQDLGYEQDGFVLPEMRVHEITVESKGTELIDGQIMMFAPVGKTLLERRSARRNSIEDRVQAAADIANGTDEQVMVWCDLNAESKALTKVINGAVEVEGTMPLEQKEAGVTGFLSGEKRVLVSKPSIAGWGLNAQCAHIVIFVGLSDSFEAYYQAVRRCWRFGQQYPVDVYIIISDAEGAVKENIARKQRDAERMTDELIAFTKEFLKNDLRQTTRDVDEYYAFERMEIPEWLKSEAS